MRKLICFALICLPCICIAQLKWRNVDSLFQPLPPAVHVFFSNDTIDGKPFIGYYVEADLHNRQLKFTTDTTAGRRLTPSQFYERNNAPLVVVNCTFFEFVHNRNLNLVMRDRRLLAHNMNTHALRGRDTLKFAHVFSSAIGINRKGNADVAWTFTDSSKRWPYAMQSPLNASVDSSSIWRLHNAKAYTSLSGRSLKKWKMNVAVGGGPVLLQDGDIKITNNEERKFGGRAINDKHPRTAMGYTKNGKLIILAIQGRFPGVAEGATLKQQAEILKDIGCTEALNLDGGGSSCLLVNGKETIRPSDPQGQRPVPAVFIIRQR